MANSTTSLSAGKPGKPYSDFPLFPHGNGKWAKKIRGKLYYFGKWADPQGALEEYMAQREALHSGRPAKPDALTIKSLGDRYLTARKHDVEAGELTQRSWDDYYVVAQLVADVLGKDRLVENLTADDFAKLKRKMAKTWGPVRVGNTIQRARTIFKWAYDSYLIDRPVRFGPGFSRPSQRVMRKHRAENGNRMFQAAEIRAALDATSAHMRAMILLAINCGFGNHDCGLLPIKALDLEAGWVDFPRPKTGVDRRCPLWPETIVAIKAAGAMGRKAAAPEHDGLVFLTKRGSCWTNDKPQSPVSQQFTKALRMADKRAAKKAKKAGLKPPAPIYQPGRGFYSLRHTCQTIAEEAGESPDFAAIDRIMGHAERSNDMAARYRERITDERLLRITDHIRAWLFGTGNESKT